ncbi:class I SAM-dependent methyltransferase [Mycobacterium heckeshornense]|uniref:Hydroxymycolate synthase MmaA4 n=1 Tax=Mycobacterium heckeshornense TaxID=110505 RepID=A0A2G8BJY7_9MYCO|nr:cyclopropane mycolic acid synthase family methyltransferase [Mycobacterium heckeshornense]KMV23807.1 SAM-dependent methyltransferase [Mycobacterium heckeshornense]MCV7033581.1 class I SAM-dependent methyltransferase [Mycobacterium heckeshornense]PIJ38091.1 class I SAM-dependent methyltransferase [Mycobacterium heckeshornense]BCO37637.1 hydroxymycolate synthase MmaA4 [Mycobacterium heckeshornense]BCQ10487.1 hydroxymycolate synthase MmaA4 [Mycobacterium heckeshornense]
MSDQPTGTTKTRTRPEDIQAHYDLSDDFFGLFQDPTRTYSCAYFERDDMTLEEAQIAKIDLNLDKLDLKPGMTLLDVGCGWGTTMKRAIEKYDVNVIGLTLSKNQRDRSLRVLDGVDTNRSHRVLLQGWEDFHEPVDRIVSIEAFEHFGHENYVPYFKNCYAIMPDDGRMTVQSSVSYHPHDPRMRGKRVNFQTARFIKFIVTEIFPGGRLPTTEMMVERGQEAGFIVPEPLSLRPHYVKTLTIWGDSLEANREKAIEVASEEVYNRYMKYLRGCRDYFADEMLDCSLVTYLKPGAAR